MSCNKPFHQSEYERLAGWIRCLNFRTVCRDR